MRLFHKALLNILIGCQVFMVFFLLFEARIDIPPLLQVMGRAHPLLLHFPIVFLVVAFLLGFLESRMEGAQQWTNPTLYGLLLLTASSAAVTAVAGLVLSKEGGYEGPGFQWHKWMGVALSFSSTALLCYRRRVRSSEGKPTRFFQVGLGVSVLILLTTGHFGAELTHGADYLFEPVRGKDKGGLDMEAAVVYDDLVYPILESKCLSCHSISKAKGGLVLSDTGRFRKGGDSGVAFVGGSLEESLLVQRLLLDLDHEHHMPPKGKPQLTDEEQALIEAWISGGADFHTRLAALAADDTLRQLAAAVYGPPLEETYGFPSADAAVIARLNSPYRVVKPLAQESPALSVAFFGASFFTGKSLRELEPVGTQVVSLSLSGMPVTENDRDLLGSFKNLRELMLNGTPADDHWSEVLASLPNLQTVSLSSTNLTEKGLASLLDMPKLKRIYVWNTPIGGEAVDRLQQQYKHITIERGYQDDGQTLIRLNDPIVKPASTFFDSESAVILSHPVNGVELRYTLDGSEPDSMHAKIYSEPLVLKNPATVRVKGYKAGWLSSGEVSRSFYPSTVHPDQMYLISPPDSRYKARGAFSLSDLASGGENHADGRWIGFHGQPMIVSAHFDRAQRVDSVGISVKQVYGAHIYPP